jgi:hypothetical protein
VYVSRVCQLGLSVALSVGPVCLGSPCLGVCGLEGLTGRLVGRPTVFFECLVLLDPPCTGRGAIHGAPIGMQNRTFGLYLAAIHRIHIFFARGRSPLDRQTGRQTDRQTDGWTDGWGIVAVVSVDHMELPVPAFKYGLKCLLAGIENVLCLAQFMADVRSIFCDFF